MKARGEGESLPGLCTKTGVATPAYARKACTCVGSDATSTQKDRSLIYEVEERLRKDAEGDGRDSPETDDKGGRGVRHDNGGGVVDWWFGEEHQHDDPDVGPLGLSSENQQNRTAVLFHYS